MKYGRPGNSSLVFLEVVLVQYDIGDYNDLAMVIDYDDLAKKANTPEAMARRRNADEIIISTAFSEIFYTGALTSDIQQLSARALIREADPRILGILSPDERSIRTKNLRDMGEVIAPSPKVSKGFRYF